MNRETPHRWSPQLAILAMALVTTFAGCSASAPPSTVVPTSSVTATPPVAPSTGQPTSATPTSAMPTPSTSLKQVDPARFRSEESEDGYFFSSPSRNLACGFLISSRSVGCQSWVKVATLPACKPPNGSPLVVMYWGQKATTGCTSEGIFAANKPKVLGYGEQLTVEDITCTSMKTGVTCVDARTGHGFTASRAAFRVIG